MGVGRQEALQRLQGPPVSRGTARPRPEVRGQQLALPGPQWAGRPHRGHPGRCQGGRPWGSGGLGKGAGVVLASQEVGLELNEERGFTSTGQSCKKGMWEEQTSRRMVDKDVTISMKIVHSEKKEK